MFSILGLINTWIGYINMNVKIKNRVYTIVGGVGNFYLLYVAWRFFANGFIGRGLLFILAFLVLLYFTYLNAIYWFKNIIMTGTTSDVAIISVRLQVPMRAPASSEIRMPAAIRPIKAAASCGP